MKRIAQQLITRFALLISLPGLYRQHDHMDLSQLSISLLAFLISKKKKSSFSISGVTISLCAGVTNQITPLNSSDPGH
jgi:hypothetical protein